MFWEYLFDLQTNGCLLRSLHSLAVDEPVAGPVLNTVLALPYPFPLNVLLRLPLTRDTCNIIQLPLFLVITTQLAPSPLVTLLAGTRLLLLIIQGLGVGLFFVLRRCELASLPDAFTIPIEDKGDGRKKHPDTSNERCTASHS